MGTPAHRTGVVPVALAATASVTVEAYGSGPAAPRFAETELVVVGTLLAAIQQTLVALVPVVAAAVVAAESFAVASEDRAAPSGFFGGITVFAVHPSFATSPAAGHSKLTFAV